MSNRASLPTSIGRVAQQAAMFNNAAQEFMRRHEDKSSKRSQREDSQREEFLHRQEQLVVGEPGHNSPGKAPIALRRRSSRMVQRDASGPYSTLSRRSSSMRQQQDGPSASSTGITTLLTDATIGDDLPWAEDVPAAGRQKAMAVFAEAAEAAAAADMDVATETAAPEPAVARAPSRRQSSRRCGEDAPVVSAAAAAGDGAASAVPDADADADAAAGSAGAPPPPQLKLAFPPPPADRRRRAATVPATTFASLVGQFPAPPANPNPGMPIIAASFAVKSSRRRSTVSVGKGKTKSSKGSR